MFSTVVYAQPVENTNHHDLKSYENPDDFIDWLLSFITLIKDIIWVTIINILLAFFKP